MNKQTVKTILRVTTQFGTGAISGAIISNNVPPQPNPILNISVKVAGFMIGGLMAEKTGDYSDRLVDDIDKVVKTSRLDVKTV